MTILEKLDSLASENRDGDVIEVLITEDEYNELKLCFKDSETAVFESTSLENIGYFSWLYYRGREFILRNSKKQTI